MFGDLLTLNSLTSGVYVVTTETGSVYTVDLDQMLVTRHRDEPDEYHELRRDEQPVTLLKLVDCRLGHDMRLLIDLRVDGVLHTTRATTVVVRIDRQPMARSS
ncbi:hypothetical protein [Agromyces laixinhei]|uniref:hypothetical protein n=1 Tax=Agromyces laixinhei TaxID=2585717 RepID=UPI001116ABFB|nr:hypothetical protein [Agromyces laixinhei]